MRRAFTTLLTVLLCIAAVAGVLLFFEARDRSQIAEQPGGPGDELTIDADVGTPGNVLIRTDDGADLDELRALAREIAGKPSEALTATGQAVIVEEDIEADGIEAVAAGSSITVKDPDDPRLREFAKFWLGKTKGEDR